MKLYIAAGQYVGTQAEAKAIDKTGFEQVEVPTDKEGLIAYLNGLAHTGALGEYTRDEYTPVVARQDPAIDASALLDRTEASIGFDDAWQGFPLARKLHFAAMACEDARASLRPMQITVPTPAVSDSQAAADAEDLL